MQIREITQLPECFICFRETWPAPGRATRVWQKEMSVVPICLIFVQNVGILFIMTSCSSFDFLKYCINIHLFFSSFVEVCCLVARSCPTLCDPLDYGLPGSSVHRILQARILEWVAISFSRWSSRPSDQTHIFCTGRQILYHWIPGKPFLVYTWQIKL